MSKLVAPAPWHSVFLFLIYALMVAVIENAMDQPFLRVTAFITTGLAIALVTHASLFYGFQPGWKASDEGRLFGASSIGMERSTPFTAHFFLYSSLAF